MKRHHAPIVWGGLLALAITLICGYSAARVLASGDRKPSQTAAAASARQTTVLFMCPHGAAKSVLASAYFQRAAKERGLNIRVEAVGIEPQDAVSPVVAGHLREQGYAVPVAQPRAVSRDDLRTADVVISMGCDLSGLPVVGGTLQKWDEVPGPGEDLKGADEAIRRRVTALVEELLARQRK